MKGHEAREAAARLRAAYGGACLASLRDLLGETDSETAYAIQDLNTRFWLGEGRRIVGRKVGLTSEVLRKRLSAAEPDYGILFDDMQLANGGSMARGSVAHPRVEGEIALVMSRDVTEPVFDAAEMLTYVEAAAPAIEIAGSRICDWAISLADTIADNASAGAFVIGEPVLPERLGDLASTRMSLSFNEVEVASGDGAQAHGSPLRSLLWLAARARLSGRPLLQGEIVLTGALAPMIDVPAPTRVEVRIEGLGAVSFECSG